jgi:sugar phosphate permease
MGTAAGQFIVAFTNDKFGWQYGFFLVVSIDISLTLIPILLIVYKEFKELIMIKNSKKAMGMDQ